MKKKYGILFLSILLFSVQTKAQKRAMGSSINVEFSNNQTKLAPPDLILGLFYQFPIRERFAINTTFSLGKKRYYSRSLLINSQGSQFFVTQYHERSFAIEQMLKVFVGKIEKEQKSKFYGAIGYSFRNPLSQNGESKMTLSNSVTYIKKKDFPVQRKINLAFGVDHYLDHKFFFSMETGFQSPIFSTNNSRSRILSGNDMFYFNIKVGIHLHKLVYKNFKNPELINIKDLEIRN